MSGGSRLHDEDSYSWTLAQATALRRLADLHPDHDADRSGLADEIEGLGRSLERELYARYKALLRHLLAWRVQPAHRSRAWEQTINEQRHEIARLLRKNPGLKPRRAGEFADAYETARSRASSETGLALGGFPTACPFSLEQAESLDFWPDAEHVA